jgi:hypothetical protein
MHPEETGDHVILRSSRFIRQGIALGENTLSEIRIRRNRKGEVSHPRQTSRRRELSMHDGQAVAAASVPSAIAEVQDNAVQRTVAA